MKELRLYAGLSQAELAKAVETTQRNISYWESGRVEINLLVAIKLAQFFQVEVEYLAGYSDEFGINPPTAAPMVNAMGESYTAEERELIAEFRKLPEDSRKLVLRMVGVSSTSQGAKKKA